MHKTTLEQWALLERVIEAGSFAKAAEETHRSQSSVSYNLSLLQERLGVALLMTEGRRAVLTPAGELLLNQVKPLLKAFAYVETRAATLRSGMRTRIDLMVDSIFPRSRLFAILRQFQQLYPQTQVRLTEVLENSRADALNDEADVMVLTRRQDITGLGEWLMNIDFVAVAHHAHPLFALDTPLNDEMLRPWPRIQIADSQPTAHPIGESWTFSTIDAAIEAVMYQVGYGWLPEERIQTPLQQGILKTLPLSHGVQVRAAIADLSSQEGVDELLRVATHVDILVNNAGIYGQQDFYSTDDETWERYWQTNVMSGVRLSRALLPGMVQKGWGRVVFISSESACNIPADMIHYGVTKTAQLSLARGLAKFVAGSGVTVNSVLPGPTMSDGFAAMMKDEIERTGKSLEQLAKEFVMANRPSSVIQRAATVEEVANMVVYVCSMQASATSGAALRVDGGVVDDIV